MKLQWKGKLTQDRAFVYPDLPESAKPLYDSSIGWRMYLLIVPVLLLAYAGIQIRLKFVDGIMFSRVELLYGVVLALPFLLIHELLHAVCCPKDCVVYMYWSAAGISMIPTSPVGKQRYIIMALLPTVVLGIAPFLVWLCIPSMGAALGSVLFGFSIASLSMSIGDIFNVLIATRKMNKESLLVTSGLQVYVIDED